MSSTKWYIGPDVVFLLFSAERLQDFMVSVSDNEPPASSGFNLLYKSAGYRPCGQYKGNPPTLEPVYMECARGAVGRYAYLLMPHYNHMHCAAFEAFGVRKYGLHTETEISSIFHHWRHWRLSYRYFFGAASNENFVKMTTFPLYQ